jgi:hypothetical protein
MSGLLQNQEVPRYTIENKPVIVDVEDMFTKKLVRSSCLFYDDSTDRVKDSAEVQIRKFEFDSIVRLQISRVIVNGIFPLRPVMSEVERGIKESELLTFTSLTPSDLYRSNQLQEFSEMVLKETKALPNFTGSLSAADGEEGSVLRRKYFRSLAAFLTAQIINKETVTDPVILRKYYPMTDQLLLGLHWPPPDRRNHRKLWTRTIFDGVESKEGEHEHEPSNSREVTFETLTITPAGQMIVKVNRLNQDNSQSWLTAHLKNSVAGVRVIAPFHQHLPSHDEAEGKKKKKNGKKRRGSGDSLNVDANHASHDELSIVDHPTSQASFHFFYETEDNVRITAFLGPIVEPIKKPDKNGTICLNIAFPNNLSIVLGSNGNIRISSDFEFLLSQYPYHHSRNHSSYALFPEKTRFIAENGSILRTFANEIQTPFFYELLTYDGTRELYLLPNALSSPSAAEVGEENHHSLLNRPDDHTFEVKLLHSIPKDTTMIKFTKEGSIQCYSQDGKQLLYHFENILVEKIDAETRSKVKLYEDGRVITEYTNGIVITLFPDNTKYTYSPANRILSITRHIGFPDIEMDIDVDSTCRKHAKGMEIPINKGGERVRSRLSLPDGSAAFVSYFIFCFAFDWVLIITIAVAIANCCHRSSMTQE